MRKALVLLGLLGVLFAQETNLATITEKLDQGIKLYVKDSLEAALGPFQEAANGFEQMLQGVLSPEDEAYARYFLATAHYYIARIQKDASLFESTSQEFNQAASAFKSLDILGEEYVRSRYMKALCSFRIYELSTSERSKAKALDQSIGDFESFLTDEDIQKNKKDFQDLIDNANYFLGYCEYQLGYIKSFDMGQLANAQKLYTKAIDAFKEAAKSQDERIAISAQIMEADCHYLLARLYFRVSDDDWDKYKLAKDERTVAAENEINNAIKILEKTISAAGTQKDLQKMAKVTKLIDQLTLGSVGLKKELNDAITALTDMKDDPDWKKDIMSRLAYGSLLNFLIFNGPPRAVQAACNRITDYDPEGIYWEGMTHFILGEYDKANAKFPAAIAQLASERTTRSKELQADAKFRQAECMFWLGVKQGNSALLNQADAIYKALENPQGEYYDYLIPDIRDQVTIRRFLIGIETSLGKEQDVSVFDAAMALAGLSLPKDAERYLSAGKYFLQKAIETAGEERKTALKFAIHAFDKVINASGVPNDIKNRAKFMKGVALVKLATVEESKDAQKSTIEEAKAVLQTCTAPYADEAKYVIGVGYFIINDYDNAKSIFVQLKGKGHIRAAYRYALVEIEKKNCTNAAKALGSILATIKDRTNPWYQKADLELSNLSCRNAASGAPSLPKYKEPPMTYENLVDEEAEKARKKKEALFVWQRSSKFVAIPDIDKLIPDRPPETNVNLEIAIEPPGGEETIIIDGKEGLVQLVDKSVYKVTLNRGTHKVVVKKKGFYKLEQEIKVSKSERITLHLNKAVRYTPSGEIGGIKNAVAVVADSQSVFVAPAKGNKIIQMDKNGNKIREFAYSDLGIGGVSGLALDGDNLIIVDPKLNQVIAVNLTEKPEAPEEEPAEEGSTGEESAGEETVSEEGDTAGADTSAAETEETPQGKPEVPKYKITVIAYSGETYGSVPLSRPAGICVKEGTYFIADAGNHRVVVFDGSSYRKDIGSDKLVHPTGVAVSEDGKLYIADIGAGKIFRYSVAGEYLDEAELKEQTQPVSVYIGPEGFVFVVDYVRNTVFKYTPDLEPLSPAGKDLPAPRAVAQIGSGPESVLFVADMAGLTVLKGGWDNTYMPE